MKGRWGFFSTPSEFIPEHPTFILFDRKTIAKRRFFRKNKVSVSHVIRESCLGKKGRCESGDRFVRPHTGRKIAGKYEVLSLLGAGWEGEVYKIREIRTGIERAAKLFFPQRNLGNKTAKIYAQKLHKLRQVPILIQYHTEEILLVRKIPITVLISDYVEGDLLSEFLKKFPGQRLHPFRRSTCCMH